MEEGMAERDRNKLECKKDRKTVRLTEWKEQWKLFLMILFILKKDTQADKDTDLTQDSWTFGRMPKSLMRYQQKKKVVLGRGGYEEEQGAVLLQQQQQQQQW